MKETIEIINQMQADGIIDAYAIGGAVAATFYMEPFATMDIDIFVSFKQSTSSPLISLSPLFTYLKNKGCETRGEYILIGGWPVQFLPPADALGEAALAAATETMVEGVPTRVITAEYLAAMALQVGRPKDTARLVQFVESGTLDPGILDGILTRHGLMNKWERFCRTYLRGTP